jgi:hypothetical protein
VLADHRRVVRCPYHFRSKRTDYYFNNDQETQVNAEGNVLNAVTLLFMLYLTALLASLLHVGVLVAPLDAEGLEEQELELLGDFAFVVDRTADTMDRTVQRTSHRTRVSTSTTAPRDSGLSCRSGLA